MDRLPNAIPQSRYAPEARENAEVSSSAGPVNVLVMNLPFRVRWQDLKDLCRQACSIERADVALEVDGRSRGFGEVTCSSRADAEKLFQRFNRYEWQGRILNVIVMQTREERPTQGSFNTSTSEQPGTEDFSNLTHRPCASGLVQPRAFTDDRLLFVGNLPFSMQWQDLKDLLRPAGRVQRTDISTSSDGRSRGWGTALFLTAEEAMSAVAMFDDMEVEGRRIKVRLDQLGGRGLPRTFQDVGPSARRRSSPSGQSALSSRPQTVQYHSQNSTLSASMPQFYYPSDPAYSPTVVVPRPNTHYDSSQQQQQQQFSYYPNDRPSSHASGTKPDKYPW